MKTFLYVMEGFIVIGTGTAIITLAGATISIGKIDSLLIHSLARSPELDTSLFGYAILGFALIEAIALFTIMMAFLISFIFRSPEVFFLLALALIGGRAQ